MDHIYSFCKTLYNCTYLPIHYYKNGQLKLVLPVTDYSFDLAGHHLAELISKGQEVSYLVTKDFNYFGLVQNTRTDQAVLIGPIISTRPSPASIRNIMQEYDIPLEYKEQLTELFQFTPIYSFHQFSSFLFLFYQELFGDVINMESYLDIRPIAEDTSIASLHSSKSYDAKETEQFHNTYHYEQMYLEYISNGTTEGLKTFFSNKFALREGRVADNALRQAKNLLIVAVTLATRCAIEGGPDIESAYQLSDIYIQEGEKLQNAEALYQLQYDMMLDFTNCVAKSQIPRNATSDIYKSIQYIQQHTNQAISVSDVAAHVGKSRAYLSHCFKKELGFQMNEFITRCKLEEAKSLLAYTDKSISEISSYLCFSSQSYFQNVFKKKYGITPAKYRQQSSPYH